MLRKYLYKKSAVLLMAFLIAAGVILCAMSAEAAPAVGKFTAVEGKVEVLRAGALPAVGVKTGDPVSVQDVVRTKSDSRAEITFSDGAVLRIAQRSRLD